MGEQWMDVTALVFSVFAFVFSLIQYLRDTTREKKEATLNAYNELQDTAFNDINQLLRELPKDEKGRISIDPSHERWPVITGYLAKIERFSVGVLCGIYDLNIVRLVSGGYLVRLYYELYLVIKAKRTYNLTKGKHYECFEKMIRKLNTWNE